MSLAQETCRPIAEDERALPPVQVEELLRETPGWTLNGKAIERDFVFRNFREAMSFIDKVADIANAQDHHPDITISYNKVTLTLSTHKIGGLSRNDFIVAARVDKAIR